MERLTVKRSDGRWALANNDGAKPLEQMEKIRLAIDRLAAYEDFAERWKLRSIEEADCIFRRVNALGGTDLMAQYRDLGPIDHLRELAQAEKDGRLVVLPCKVGNMVWCISRAYKTILQYTVAGYLNDGFIWKVRMTKTIPSWVGNRMEHKYVAFNSFGKTAFLTHEEAKAALKKREADSETD